MEKRKTNILAAAAGMLSVGCLCALMAGGCMSLADGAITAAVMAVFYVLWRLARRYCSCLEWLAQALFCGVGYYVAAQILSLGVFAWASTADGPLHELGAAWIGCIFALLYAIGRGRFAVIGTGVLTFAFGAANYALTQFRGRPFLLIDFESLKTAINVSGAYDLNIEPIFVLGVVYTIAFAVLAWALFPKPEKKGSMVMRVLSRALPVVASAVYVYLCLYCGLMYSNGIYMNWNDNEFRASSVMYFIATASTLDIEPPDGYSPEALDSITLELLDKAKEYDDAYYASTDGSKPDIIVIMSESFSDLRQMGDFETDKSFFDFFDELEDESIHGHVYSSVLGGNTANSEFEMLTGDTMAFLPSGSVAYQTYINYPIGTLVSTLEDQGYSSTMLHPHWSTGWNRVQVYGLFGFDNTYWRDSFSYTTTMRGYTTDKWNYNKLIELYEQERAEQSDDEGVFLFNITMQNHGGYTNSTYTSTVHIKGHEGQFPKAEQYLSVLSVTDEDTREFIDYLRGIDHEVILMFFGDHQPNLEKEFYDLAYGYDTSNLTLPEMERKYITPFYIWSNKGLEARDEGYTSINYLSQLLLETAGLRNTPYGYFLSELQEKWPVINGNGAMDASGDWHNLNDGSMRNDKDLLMYHMMEYNQLFDPSDYREELFTLAK